MVRADGCVTRMLALAVMFITGSGCAGPAELPQSPAVSVITSTTKIAGAGVLGNQRRPDESCASQPVRPDPGPSLRWAPNTAGVEPREAQVSADPQRIVVLSGDQLDALCALGLQSRIVAAALPDDSDQQPAYLGTAVHEVPAVGTRSAPDVAAITAAQPDLILGSSALTLKLYAALTDIAPTVFTAAPGAAWADNLRGVGAATARADAAEELVDRFVQHAADTGAAHDADHFQASVVVLTENSLRVYGSANFPASVLRAVGVDRPAAQRFIDKPYLEISLDDLPAADFTAADGDVVYLSFASRAAKGRAEAVLDSPPWRKLSAYRDNRVFVVNNEVWQTGRGLIAARGIVDDLRWVDAPIN